MGKYNLGLSTSSGGSSGSASGSASLSLGTESRLKLNLSDLCLAPTDSKALFEFCSSVAGDGGTPMVRLEDAPKPVQGALIKALNDFRNNYTPSVQPGFGITGKQFKSGFHTLFGYSPGIVPDEAVLYINPAGGAGVGIRFSTKEMKYEFGIHLMPTDDK